jgi:hypothetical protein
MPCPNIVNEVVQLKKLANNDNDILGPLGKLEIRYTNPNMTCGQVNAENFGDALYDIEKDENKLDKLLTFMDGNKNVSPRINELLNTPRGGKSRRRRRRSTRKHVRKTRRNRRRHSRRHRK